MAEGRGLAPADSFWIVVRHPTGWRCPLATASDEEGARMVKDHYQKRFDKTVPGSQVIVYPKKEWERLTDEPAPDLR